jgi:transposase InsO family protein
MTHDDVLFGYRLRLFTLAEELGNVSAACRQMGISRSTYYAWKPRLERYGLDGLRVRERRRPRMPNQLGPHLEHRILAFSLGHPGFGARRIAAELGRPKWGAIRISENGVYGVLRRFNLNTRAKRLALIARHADPYERKPATASRELHIEASVPGEKVQMDCFFVGRLAGAKGVIWQYTATDVASASTWAFLRSTHLNPAARYTAELVHLVARELKAAGWRLKEVTTDNGSEFRSREFGDAAQAAGTAQRRIKAGRPNSNGCVERVQLTILEECWRPAFSRSLAPKITALRRDLDEYLSYYNGDRAHTGRLTRGRVPADIVCGAHKMASVR